MKWLAIVMLATATAAAQPAPENDPAARAKQLYLQGKRYYDVGDYAQAVEAWKQSYVLSTAPMLLFNIAQAYRLSGDCLQALRFYANYERESPTVPNRDELEQAKARCNPQPTDAHPPPPPPEPESAVSATTPVAPAPSTPVAISTPASPRDVVDPGPRWRTSGLVTGAGGVVLLGTSLWLGMRARDKASQVEAHRGEWTADIEAVERSGKRAATWSLATGITGALAVVAGGALYVYGRRAARRTIDVAIHPDAAQVTWSGSF